MASDACVVWHAQFAGRLAVTGWSLVAADCVHQHVPINHFELFGVHQVANNLTGRQMPVPRFPHAAVLQVRAAPDLSRFIIAFWPRRR